MQPIPEVPEKPVQMQEVVGVVSAATAPQYGVQAQPQWTNAPVMATVAAPSYVRPLYGGQAVPISLWSSSACSCMDDIDSAVESLFCIRCQMSRQYNMITYSSNAIEPWTFLGSLGIDVLLGAPLTATVFAWWLRNKIRARYQIAGDNFNDCLMAVFMPWCSTAQIYREMSLRGEWTSGCCINQQYTLLPPPTQAMENGTAAQV